MAADQMMKLMVAAGGVSAVAAAPAAAASPVKVAPLPTQNPINELNEAIRSGKLKLITSTLYHHVTSGGPAHLMQHTWSCETSLGVTHGTGATVKDAKRLAAEQMLLKLQAVTGYVPKSLGRSGKPGEMPDVVSGPTSPRTATLSSSSSSSSASMASACTVSAHGHAAGDLLNSLSQSEDQLLKALPKPPGVHVIESSAQGPATGDLINFPVNQSLPASTTASMNGPPMTVVGSKQAAAQEEDADSIVFHFVAENEEKFAQMPCVEQMLNVIEFNDNEDDELDVCAELESCCKTLGVRNTRVHRFFRGTHMCIVRLLSTGGVPVAMAWATSSSSQRKAESNAIKRLLLSAALPLK